MKERVTLTIDEDILKTIDASVDGRGIKNRSHAIELLLRKALKGDVPAKAVILAGGRGTRLQPVTKHTPKSLIELNKQPILQYNIDLCKRYGITDIILSIGHLGDQIKEYYGDGSAHGIRITYVEESEPLGTAGPLRKIKHKLTETFILMNGDELKDINLRKIHRFHVEQGGRATIALTTVEDPSAYGVALMDGAKIVRFVEKPPRGDEPSKLINAGLYILEPEVIDLLPEGFSMMEQDVFPKLAKDQDLYGYPFSGQWFDTGTTERLDNARKHWEGFSA